VQFSLKSLVSSVATSIEQNLLHGLHLTNIFLNKSYHLLNNTESTCNRKLQECEIMSINHKVKTYDDGTYIFAHHIGAESAKIPTNKNVPDNDKKFESKTPTVLVNKIDKSISDGPRTVQKELKFNDNDKVNKDGCLESYYLQTLDIDQERKGKPKVKLRISVEDKKHIQPLYESATAQSNQEQEKKPWINNIIH
jgi:hypothetical protein